MARGRGPATEEFRSLAARLQALDASRPLRCIGVVSTVVGVDWLTSRHRLGFLFRVGTGLHLLEYPSPGRSGLYPALATAIGFRVPFGPRGAFLVEGRYDRLFGVKAGPSRLMPVLFGFEL